MKNKMFVHYPKFQIRKFREVCESWLLGAPDERLEEEMQKQGIEPKEEPKKIENDENYVWINDNGC
ncbi:MAG: hypothetical protein V1661_01990 [bacterium]